MIRKSNRHRIATAGLAAMAGLAIVTSTEVAAAQDLYALGAIGQTNINASDVDFDENTTSFRIGVGSKLGGQENLFIEGFYIDYGSADKSYGGGYSATASGTALAGQVVFKNALEGGLSIFGKLGLALWDGEVKYSGPGGSSTDSDDGNDIYFGFGAEKALDSMSALRFEWEKITFNVEDTDIDATTLGIYYIHKM